MTNQLGAELPFIIHNTISDYLTSLSTVIKNSALGCILGVHLVVAKRSWILDRIVHPK